MLVSESVAARKACAYTRVYIGKYSCTAAIAAARSIAGAQWLDKGWRADKWLVNEKEGRAWRAAAYRHDGPQSRGQQQAHCKDIMA